jgi:tetratricopeptide (TPR) repeat protein
VPGIYAMDDGVTSRLPKRSMLTPVSRSHELSVLRPHLSPGAQTGVAGLAGSGRLAFARQALPLATLIRWSESMVWPSIADADVIVDARGCRPMELGTPPDEWCGRAIWLLDARIPQLPLSFLLGGLSGGAARQRLIAHATSVEPMFDAASITAAQYTAIVEATGGLDGLLSVAGRALPVLGAQAVVQALSGLGAPQQPLDTEWFVADVVRRAAHLDDDALALTCAALAVDRPLPLESLTMLAGRSTAGAARLIRAWHDHGLTQSAAGEGLCPTLLRPVRSVLLRRQAELGLPMDEVAARVYGWCTPRPDDTDAPLDPVAWSDVLYAATHLRVSPMLRWRLLVRLDESARDVSQRTALQSLASEPADDPSSRLLMARRWRSSGQVDLSLVASETLLNDVALAPAARLEHGRTLYAAGRLTEAARILESLDDTTPPAWLCEALRTRAAIALGADQVLVARSCAAQSLALARAHNLHGSQARAAGLLATIELADAQLDRALEHLLQARSLCETNGDLHGEIASNLTLASLFVALQRHADATQVLDHSEILMRDHEYHAFSGLLGAARALNAMDQGTLPAARQSLEKALSNCSEAQPRIYAWIVAHLGVLLALEGQREQAWGRLSDAAGRFARMADVRNAQLFGYWTALVGEVPPDVAVVLAARPPLSQELLSLAGLAAGGAGVDAGSAWVRLASRVTGRQRQPAVLRDGTWIRTDAGELVDLRRRMPARRVLAALIEAGRRGGAMSTTDLFAAAWPGDRSRQDAARARVYVAINELRKSGLGTTLRSDSTGYWLSGVRVIDDEAAMGVLPDSPAAATGERPRRQA